MPFVNPSQLQNARIAVSTILRDAYNSVPKDQLWYNRIATEVPSNSDAEAYFVEHLLPRLREWIGPRIIRGIKREAVTVQNRTFEGTVGLAVNDIRFDKFTLQRGAIAGLGRSGALWPNDLILSALTDTTTTWLDGQPFFNGSHPLVPQDAASSTQSNLHTTMSLTAANFATVRSRIRLLKGEDNQPLRIGTGKLLLIVPQALEDTAKRIVGTDMAGFLHNASSTAVDNNLYKNAADVLVLPELDATSSTTWYLIDPSTSVKPFIFQVNQKPNSIVSIDRPTDEHVFLNDEVLFGVKGIGNYAFGLWQAAHKCTA